MNFTEYIDLAVERLGGRVLAANDEFFAPKENLLKGSAPIWIEDRYTDVGKWMDGWETRRRRTPGYDWCVVKLGLPGACSRRGSGYGALLPRNLSRSIARLEASAAVDGDPSVSPGPESPSTRWSTLLPKSPLNWRRENLFPITPSNRVTHLRFRNYPDGGVARLRVHGEVVPGLAGDRARGRRNRSRRS